VFKAHRLLYHSTLGLRVIKKKKKDAARDVGGAAFLLPYPPPYNQTTDYAEASLIRP